MSAHVIASAYESRERAREQAVLPAKADEEVLSHRSAAGAGVVALAAVLLAAAPALVAAVAIISPGELDQLYAWLLGGSLVFSLVAAGRVPAAALLAIVLARRRTRSRL